MEVCVETESMVTLTASRTKRVNVLKQGEFIHQVQVKRVNVPERREIVSTEPTRSKDKGALKFGRH